jgi:hypothetical protein
MLSRATTLRAPLVDLSFDGVSAGSAVGYGESANLHGILGNLRPIRGAAVRAPPKVVAVRHNQAVSQFDAVRA